MEAIVLCGGKAERLGEAAGGRPKSLVEVAGKPLVGYQVARLARAGVERVIISCAAGEGELFEQELAGLGPEVVAAEEPERLGRGGGIKFAARARDEDGDVYALNGDELVEIDFEALLERHRETGAAATVAVARPKSPFGVVDLGEDDVVQGFQEAGRIPYWVNCGIYVFSDEVIGRLPDVGDHETTTFPELVRERRLRGFRHEGLWLTVNTPKELRTAAEHLAAHPEWLGLVTSPLEAWAFAQRKVEKPWGHELIWALTDVYCGKVLFVKAGHSLSLQLHREKDESWLVHAGRAKVELGREGDAELVEDIVEAGSAFRFEPGTVHRVTALEDTTILEVSTPQLDDVVRLEDRYGRAGT